MAKKNGFRNKAHAILSRLKNAGKRVVHLAVYGKDGKVSWRKVALTTGLIAAAGAGAYAVHRHRKHGHVIRPTAKKKSANRKKARKAR